jgi:hypothetical protein
MSQHGGKTEESKMDTVKRIGPRELRMKLAKALENCEVTHVGNQWTLRGFVVSVQASKKEGAVWLQLSSKEKLRALRDAQAKFQAAIKAERELIERRENPWD